MNILTKLYINTSNSGRVNCFTMLKVNILQIHLLVNFLTKYTYYLNKLFHQNSSQISFIVNLVTRVSKLDLMK